MVAGELTAPRALLSDAVTVAVLSAVRPPLGPALAAVLAAVAGADGNPRRAPAVLDCGGGSGRLAVAIAATGASVTVVDLSIDALSILSRRAEEVGVADRVRAVQGDVDALPDLVPAASFDLVLAHEVLGAVDDPARVVAAAAGAVRPGGSLSVVIDNPAAAVLARALGGDVAAALSLLRDDGEPGELGAVVADLPSLTALIERAGLSVERAQGLGMFSGLVPGAALDATPAARASLAELDRIAATRSPYREIAASLHVLARRPAGEG